MGIVYTANYNSPGQTVISGEIAALGAAMQLAVAEGAKRVIRLAVSIAAHSPVMQRAGEQFTEALSRINLTDARIPLVANVTGQAITSAADVRLELEQQITKSVRWAQSCQRDGRAGSQHLRRGRPGTGALGAGQARESRGDDAMSIGDLKSLTDPRADATAARRAAPSRSALPAQQPV